jgi:hypothetical protein
LADSGHPWVLQQAVRMARELDRHNAETLAERLQPRLSELAAELGASDEFRSVRGAEARVRLAGTWVATNHSDGVRMPDWWVKELYLVAKDHHGGQLSFR